MNSIKPKNGRRKYTKEDLLKIYTLRRTIFQRWGKATKVERKNLAALLQKTSEDANTES